MMFKIEKFTIFEWILLAVISLVFIFGLIFRNLNTGLWWDEASFLVQAKDLSGENICISETNSSWEAHRLPGFSLILIPFIKIFDLNLSLLRFLQTIFVVITIIFLYLFACEMYGKKTAIISVILLSSSWLVLFYSLRILAHIPAMAIAVCALYLFYVGWEKGKSKSIILSGFLFGFYYLIRIESIYFILALVFYLFLKEKFSLIKNKKFYLLLIPFLIPFLIYQLWEFSNFGAFLYQEKLNYELVKHYGESYLAFFPMLPHIIAGSLLGIPISLIFFIIGLAYTIINYKKKTNLLLSIFFIIFFISASISPHHEDRYFIPVLPVIFIITSIAIILTINTITKNDSYRMTLYVITALFLSYLSITYGWQIIMVKAPTYSVVIEAGKQISYLTNKYVFVPFSVNAPHPQVCLFAKDKIFLSVPVSNQSTSQENLNKLIGEAREKDALIYYAFPYDGDIDYLTIRRFLTSEGMLDNASYSNWLNESGLEIVRILRENETGAIVIIYKVAK